MAVDLNDHRRNPDLRILKEEIGAMSRCEQRVKVLDLTTETFEVIKLKFTSIISEPITILLKIRSRHGEE